MNPKAFAPLGGASVDHFLSHHWQRRPLLVRQAFPGFEPPLSVDALLELAASDEVESRLVARSGKRWELAHGPFAPEELPPRERRRWTVLVQGVDLHDDAAAALLRRFAFVPHARVDDLMISYASDGGGVGPHLDSYDVFLIQAHGRRRWRIAPPGDDAFVPGLPLKILQRFKPTEEWVLEPGDMLYLPPGWGHDGEAVGPDCMTCSIGFRAPSRAELLAAFLADAADRGTLQGLRDARFSDAGRAPTRHPGRLPEDLRDFARDAIARWRPSTRDVDQFLGRWLTEPKPSVFFDAPRRPPTRAAFEARAARAGLVLDRRSRMLSAGPDAFINGEHLRAPAPLRRLLAQLADAHALDAQAAAAACAADVDGLLHDWHGAGWLHVAPQRIEPARPAPRGTR